MKINRDQRLTGVTRNKSGITSKTARKAINQGTDQVELSRTKDEVSKLKTIMQQIPDIGTEKIPQLRQQIDDGTYHVDAKDVAEKMLNHWNDFNGR